MPTFNSVEYAKWVADPSPGVHVNEWHGRVRMRYANSPGFDGLAQNDFVRLFPIYRGERPLFFVISNEANTASLTADIGLEGGTENKYVTAAEVADTPAVQLVGSLSRVPETADGIVTMKLEGANPADDAAIDVTMFYVID